MSWTHGPSGAQPTPERLESARDAFRQEQRVLEEARDDVMHAHAETARLWNMGR